MHTQVHTKQGVVYTDLSIDYQQLADKITKNTFCVVSTPLAVSLYTYTGIFTTTVLWVALVCSRAYNARCLHLCSKGHISDNYVRRKCSRPPLLKGL